MECSKQKNFRHFKLLWWRWVQSVAAHQKALEETLKTKLNISDVDIRKDVIDAKFKIRPSGQPGKSIPDIVKLLEKLSQK